jgi:hypothetical protein
MYVFSARFTPQDQWRGVIERKSNAGDDSSQVVQGRARDILCVRIVTAWEFGFLLVGNVHTIID